MFGIDDIILGATVAGAATSLFGASQKQKDQKKLMAEQLKEEELRREQMKLNSLNERRAIIRNAQVAASIGLANRTNAGVFGSAEGGARGQTQGKEGTALTTNWANFGIGDAIINSNEAQARLKQRIGADEGIMGLGGALMSLGGPLGRMLQPRQALPNTSIGSGGDASGNPFGGFSGGFNIGGEEPFF